MSIPAPEIREPSDGRAKRMRTLCTRLHLRAGEQKSGERTGAWNGNEAPAYQDGYGYPGESYGNGNGYGETPDYQYTPQTTIPIVPATSPAGIDYHLGGGNE